MENTNKIITIDEREKIIREAFLAGIDFVY
jgi:hypothetical protein